jgi:hypothetical protein
MVQAAQCFRRVWRFMPCSKQTCDLHLSSLRPVCSMAGTMCHTNVLPLHIEAIITSFRYFDGNTFSVYFQNIIFRIVNAECLDLTGISG